MPLWDSLTMELKYSQKAERLNSRHDVIYDLNTFKSKIRKLDLVGLTEDNCKNCTLCSS